MLLQNVSTDVILVRGRLRFYWHIYLPVKRIAKSVPAIKIPSL